MLTLVLLADIATTLLVHKHMTMRVHDTTGEMYLL